jgi:hypothetical protein
MRTSGRPSGPFREQLYFEPSEIDDICADALSASGYMPSAPGPVNIERFVEKHLSCEAGYEELPDEVMGFTAFNKKGKVVSVRIQSRLEDGTKTGERRVRSTWAHEGGHGLLHAVLFIEVPGSPTLFQCANSNVSDNKILCRNSDIKPVGARYDGRWWEWQANRCIGGLLLPKPLVATALAHLLRSSQVTGTPSLPTSSRLEAEDHVADVFNVSAVVARIRLEEMFPTGDSKQLSF